MPNANRIVWERDLLLRMYMYTSIKHSTAAMVFGTVNFIVQASDWFALWRHTTIERERESERVHFLSNHRHIIEMVFELLGIDAFHVNQY